jgi:hypothetical protein
LRFLTQRKLYWGRISFGGEKSPVKNKDYFAGEKFLRGLSKNQIGHPGIAQGG